MVHCLHFLPLKQNRDKFFREISVSLNKIINEYENVLLAGYVNVGLLNNSNDQANNFSDLKDTFNFTNLVMEATCFKAGKLSLIDGFLTSKQNRSCLKDG